MAASLPASSVGLSVTGNMGPAAVAALSQLKNMADGAAKSMTNAGNSAGYLQMSLQRIATYTAIFTFFGTLGKLVNEIFEAELRLAEVGTLIDKSNQQQVDSYNKVKQQLMAMSPYLGNLTELTKGFYEIMSAGIKDPVEAMKLLLVSAQYAKVGLTDLGTSAAMLTSVMLAYGFTADHMKQVTDVLFKSVAQGKFHAEDLNAAIGTVLPTAAAMGVSIEEVSAALAFLSNRGLSASQSATALNRMMLSLLKPTKSATVAMNQMGIETGISAFKGIGLVGVLEKLQQGSAIYANTLSDVFRRETGLRAAFALTGDLEGYKKILYDMTKQYQGLSVVEGNFNDMNKTVKMELKAWWASLIQAGQGLMGYSREISVVIGVLRDLTITMVKQPMLFGAMGIGIGTLSKGLQNQAGAIARLTALRVADVTATVLDNKNRDSSIAKIDKEIASRERLSRSFSFFRGLIIAAAVAYDVLKSAIDNIVKKADEEFISLEKRLRIYRDIKEQMVWMANVGKINLFGNDKNNQNVTLAVQNKSIDLFVDELKRASKESTNFGGVISDVLGKLRNSDKDLGGWISGTQRIIDRVVISTPGISRWEQALTKIIPAMKNGTFNADEYRDVLLEMAKATGKQELAMIRLTDSMMKNPAVAKEVFQRQNELKDMAGLVGKALGITTTDFMSLASSMSASELKRTSDALRTIYKDLDKLKSNNAEKSILKGAGLDVDISDLGPKLQFLIGKFQEALKVKRELDMKEMVNDFTDQFVGAVEAVSVMGDKAQALFVGVERGLAIMTAGGKDTKTALEPNRQLIEKLLNSIEQFGPKAQASIRSWATTLGLISTDAKKLLTELNNLHESNNNRILDLDAKLAEQQNLLEGDKADNIIVKTNLWADKVEEKLKDEFDLAVRLHKMGAVEYQDYVEALIKLDKVRYNAVELAEQKSWSDRKKNILDFVENYARINDVKFDTPQQFADAMGNMLAVLGETPAKIRLLMPELIKLGLSFDGLGKTVESLTKQAFDAFSSSLSSLVTILKDIKTSLGDSNPAFTKFVDVLDAVAKGVRSVISGFDAFRAAQKLVDSANKNSSTSMQKFIAGLSSAVSAITLVISVVSFLIDLFVSLSKTENYAETQHRKEEKAAKDAEEAYQALTAAVIQYNTAMENTIPVIGNMADAINDANFWTILYENKKSFSEFLSDIIITKNNIGDLWNRLNQMPILDSNIGEIGKSFSKLLEAAKRLGTEGSSEMIKFINQVKASGKNIQEVTDYINDQLGVQKKASMNGVQGLEAMAKAGGNTEESMARLSRQALAVYNAMIANGVSASDAAASMGPALDAISAQYARLGIEAPAAIQELLKIQEVRKANEDLFTAIDANLAILNALGNTGALTQQTLNDAAAAAANQYQQLQDAGLSSNEALAQMAPTLSRLKYLAEQQNLTLDAGTQALIDQAEAAGLITKPMATMNDLTDTILGAIGVLVQTMGGTLPEAMQKAVDKLNGLPEAAATANNTLLGDNGLVNTLGEKMSIAIQDGPIKKMGDLKLAGVDAMSGIGKSVDDLKSVMDKTDLKLKIGTDATSMNEFAKKFSDLTGQNNIPHFAGGGVAWHKQLAWVGENEPEVIAPLSDVGKGMKRRSMERSMRNDSFDKFIQLQVDLDGQTVYKGLKPYYQKDALYGGIEQSGDGVF